MLDRLIFWLASKRLRTGCLLGRSEAAISIREPDTVFICSVAVRGGRNAGRGKTQWFRLREGVDTMAVFRDAGLFAVVPFDKKADSGDWWVAQCQGSSPKTEPPNAGPDASDVVVEVVEGVARILAKTALRDVGADAD